MKINATILFLSVIFISICSAQQSSDYFPAQTGFKWQFKQVPLDSLNNEIDSLTFFRADSFAVVTPYQGETADIVLSKYGSLNSLPSAPYIDSSFYNFHDSNTDVYFQLAGFGYIAGFADSLGLDTISNIISVLQSYQDWYTPYRFASPENLSYTIFSKDTTISVGGNDFPVSFTYKGKRLADENIQLSSGNYICKKFVLTGAINLYYVIPVFTVHDTVWITQGLWMVKDLIPSIAVDLTALGYGTYYIPGLQTEMMQSLTFVDNHKVTPEKFSLSQNYPNPFNPTTEINFNLSQDGFVQLKIFNIIGQEVSTLLNEYEPAGLHQIKFNASSLPSGVYLYRLIVKNNKSITTFSATKKMLLIK